MHVVQGEPAKGESVCLSILDRSNLGSVVVALVEMLTGVSDQDDQPEDQGHEGADREQRVQDGLLEGVADELELVDPLPEMMAHHPGRQDVEDADHVPAVGAFLPLDLFGLPTQDAESAVAEHCESDERQGDVVVADPIDHPQEGASSKEEACHDLAEAVDIAKHG